VDEADDVTELEAGKSIIQTSPGGFCGQPAAPKRPPKHPAQFNSRPTFGVDVPDSAHQFAGCFLLDGPHAVTSEVPGSQKNCDVPPGIRSGRGLAIAQKAGHFGLAANGVILIEVIASERSKA